MSTKEFYTVVTPNTFRHLFNEIVRVINQNPTIKYQRFGQLGYSMNVPVDEPYYEVGRHSFPNTADNRIVHLEITNEGSVDGRIATVGVAEIPGNLQDVELFQLTTDMRIIGLDQNQRPITAIELDGILKDLEAL